MPYLLIHVRASVHTVVKYELLKNAIGTVVAYNVHVAAWLKCNYHQFVLFILQHLCIHVFLVYSTVLQSNV